MRDTSATYWLEFFTVHARNQQNPPPTNYNTKFAPRFRLTLPPTRTRQRYSSVLYCIDRISSTVSLSADPSVADVREGVTSHPVNVYKSLVSITTRTSSHCVTSVRKGGATSTLWPMCHAGLLFIDWFLECLDCSTEQAPQNLGAHIPKSNRFWFFWLFFLHQCPMLCCNPNTDIDLWMYVVLMVTKCSSERYFSKF